MNLLHLLFLCVAIVAGCALLGCAPGPIGTLFGISDPGTNPGVPNPGSVSSDYLNLISGYAQGLPSLLQAQKQFQPAFINSDLQGTNQSLFGSSKAPGLLADLGSATPALSNISSGANTAARAANVGDVGALGGAAAAAVGSINPEATALSKALTQTAATGLAAGSQLDPATLNAINQGVRGDWANRGLGNTQPAMLNEAVQQAVGGQNLLQSREAAASNAINESSQTITAPAFSLLGSQSQAPNQAFSLLGGGTNLASTAGPTVINPQQSYDTFNTAYNARAASQIAAAQNQAATDAY